jgi:sterol desaturase/sphingolipid hydroxylase (fatty acid hydroxylase superfamily)
VEFLLQNERDIYTLGLFGAVIVVILWEKGFPRRKLTQSLSRRWGGNYSIWLVNFLIIYITMPFAVVGFAIIAKNNGIGLFNWLDLPVWLEILMGFLVMDLGRYVFHYLFHRISLLWRLHRIHHADLDYDYTIGIRFHPLEGLMTPIASFCVIALTGAPPIAVMVGEVMQAVSGIFVHANARTWGWIERWVRLALVTPDMHRVHHSVEYDEHNSNYGTVLSIWDRLFRTYRRAPAAGHEGMIIGLPDLRNPECLKLSWMLLAPFRRIPPAPSDDAEREGR